MSAQGKDFSAYQAPVTAAGLAGLDFAFVKATEGSGLTDPHFAGNWQVLRDAGLHRGAYHEYYPAASPQAQAQHLVSTVRAAGLRPGDMLAVVASDYPGVTDAAIAAFAGTVRGLAPGCPVLCYSDLSVARTLTATAQACDLWVAWPSLAAPGPAQWAPAGWATWRFWQWGTSAGIDADAYNGDRDSLDAWISAHAAGAPAPVIPVPLAEDDPMPVTIPPQPADAPVLATGVSFDGGMQYKTIGFLADPGVLGGGTVTVRCAFHTEPGGKAFTVVDATMNPEDPKAVITVPAWADGVSFTRLDNMPIVLVPNFAA